MRRSLRIASIAAIAMIFATPVSGRPLVQPFLTDGADLAAPRGFVAMCREGGELCAPSPMRMASADAASVSSQPAGPAVAGPAPRDAVRAADPVVMTGWRDAGDRSGGTGAILSGPEARTRRRFDVAARLAPVAVVKPRDVPADDAPLTAAQLALLTRVNRFVNGHVRQETDMQIYGVAEHWAASGTGRGARGDCEDVAIEKRLELIHAGFPADRLFFAVVYRSDIGLHTLLIARTDDGDVVLDSRTPYIVAWSDAPYSWVGWQSRTAPMKWYRPGARTFQMADALGGGNSGV